MNKICFSCNKELPISSFYKHKRMTDGHLNKCKECVKIGVRKNRESNIERYREYDKARNRQEHRVEARRLYKKTENGKLALKKATIGFKNKYPNKYKATSMVNNAIRNGKLFREPCEVCKEPKSQAHHGDYLKPLNVRWLCDNHHKQWHKENGEGKNG